MAEWVSDNLATVIVAVLVLLAFVLWLVAASRRTRIERSEDVASAEGPARRNQALIDAPRPTAQVDLPPPTPEALAGTGPAVAAAAQPVHESLAGDDLKRIKGIGPKLETLLNSLGVTRYSQIAAWGDDEIDRIDAQLGTFQGRIRRDNWPEQARFLEAGDTAGFESRFGRT